MLVVALFLPWYRAGGDHVNAWRSMSVDDVLLALLAVGTLVATAATASRRRVAVPVAYATLSTLAGLLALILTAWRLVDPAPPVDTGLTAGAWLGLVAALGMAGGSWAGMSDEGPARRSPKAARAAASAGLERAELVALPPDVGREVPAAGDHA